MHIKITCALYAVGHAAGFAVDGLHAWDAVAARGIRRHFWDIKSKQTHQGSTAEHIKFKVGKPNGQRENPTLDLRTAPHHRLQAAGCGLTYCFEGTSRYGLLGCCGALNSLLFVGCARRRILERRLFFPFFIVMLAGRIGRTLIHGLFNPRFWKARSVRPPQQEGNERSRKFQVMRTRVYQTSPRHRSNKKRPTVLSSAVGQRATEHRLSAHKNHKSRLDCVRRHVHMSDQKKSIGQTNLLPRRNTGQEPPQSQRVADCMIKCLDPRRLRMDQPTFQARSPSARAK